MLLLSVSEQSRRVKNKEKPREIIGKYLAKVTCHTQYHQDKRQLPQEREGGRERERLSMYTPVFFNPAHKYSLLKIRLTLEKGTYFFVPSRRERRSHQGRQSTWGVGGDTYRTNHSVSKDHILYI